MCQAKGGDMTDKNPYLHEIAFWWQRATKERKNFDSENVR